MSQAITTHDFPDVPADQGRNPMADDSVADSRQRVGFLLPRVTHHDACQAWRSSELEHARR
jgi:hypothetical protein